MSECEWSWVRARACVYASVYVWVAYVGVVCEWCVCVGVYVYVCVCM